MGLETRELQLRFAAGREDEPAARRGIAQDLVPEAANFGDGGHVLPVVDDERARLAELLVHLGQEVGRDAWPR